MGVVRVEDVREEMSCAAPVASHATPVADAIADENDKIAGLFDAQPGTFYLLRPDLHIAGRWKAIVASEILRAAHLCLGKATP